MGKLLELLAKRHKDWLRMAESLGAGNYAEDAVQEMYLKMHRHEQKRKALEFNDGDINTLYIYFAIRSVVVDHQRKEALVHTIEPQCINGLDIEDITQLDVERHSDKQKFADLMEILDYEIKNWHWYDQILCDLYFGTDKSMRDIAKETGISLTSIYNTIKNGKERLREAVKRLG